MDTAYVIVEGDIIIEGLFVKKTIIYMAADAKMAERLHAKGRAEIQAEFATQPEFSWMELHHDENGIKGEFHHGSE